MGNKTVAKAAEESVMKNFLYISIAVFFFLSGCAKEAVKEKDAEQQVTVDDARILEKDGFTDTQKQKRLLIPYFIKAKYNGEDVLVDRKDGRMFYCKDF